MSGRTSFTEESFDKDYFFNRSKLDQDAPIRWKDLDETVEVMCEIIDRYSVEFDGNTYIWDPINIDDLDVLLNRARRGRPKRLG